MSRKIIAILRGIHSHEAAGICENLIEAGITRIEVPLNSPDPFDAITAMAKVAGDHATIGAGTVFCTGDVVRVKSAGGTMIVSPNTDQRVIVAAKTAEMLSYPGVLTPTECFLALKSGADGLKMFPSFLLGTEGLMAINAVLPEGTETYAVGGVGPDNFAEWIDAGAAGFGIGSGIYKPGFTAQDVKTRAFKIVAAYDAVVSR